MMITAVALCSAGMTRKHADVAAIASTAKRFRAMRRFPVRRRSASEIRPPSRMVTHAPAHGIIPMYHSEVSEKPN